MSVVYAMERHHEVLHLWRKQEASALRVVHLDFHCDLRGLLIDRPNRRAFRVWDRFADLDQGNFLKHAVLEHRIDAITWVHDEPGGRVDDIGTVKYESDLSALPYKVMLARHADGGIPLEYAVVTSADWDGLRPGELLDVDWDYFACAEYDPSTIESRIEAFWERIGPTVPEAAYVCYSPEYSHPTRERFRDFVNELANRLGFSLVVLEPPQSRSRATALSLRRYLPDAVYSSASNAYRSTLRAVKRRGIF